MSGARSRRPDGAARTFSAFRSACPDLTDIVAGALRTYRAGLKLHHIEQVGDEAVEPFGLLDHGREKFGLVVLRPDQDRGSAPAKPRTEQAAS